MIVSGINISHRNKFKLLLSHFQAYRDRGRVGVPTSQSGVGEVSQGILGHFEGYILIFTGILIYLHSFVNSFGFWGSRGCHPQESTKSALYPGRPQEREATKITNTSHFPPILAIVLVGKSVIVRHVLLLRWSRGAGNCEDQYDEVAEPVMTRILTKDDERSNLMTYRQEPRRFQQP